MHYAFKWLHFEPQNCIACHQTLVRRVWGRDYSHSCQKSGCTSAYGNTCHAPAASNPTTTVWLARL